MDIYWHVNKIIHKYKLVGFFGAKSIVKINYILQHSFHYSSSASAKV